MEKYLEWKIFYLDGLTYSNEDGPIGEAPGRGVIVISEASKETGRDDHNGWDWYFYHDDFGWWGCDVFGLHDQLLTDWPKIRKIVMGRSVSNELFNEIKKKPYNDPRLPEKTGFRRGESPAQRYGSGSPNTNSELRMRPIKA